MSESFGFRKGTALTAANDDDMMMALPMQMDGDSQETMMDSQGMVQNEPMEQDSQETARPPAPAHNSPESVIASIETHVAFIIECLDNEVSPVLSSDTLTRRFTLSQSRSFASIVMVLSFCHSLLLSGRTTTTREVYYFLVTHFRNQRECDAAILDAANFLGVPRSSLGLYASPKGWFCGCVEIVRDGVVTDGSNLPSVQGLPITREWIDGNDDFEIRSTNARCIMAIEKEGVYNRLSEDRFFEHYPCILVTGKGFPDLASRAMVHRLEQELDLPVYGLADLNPFGLGVLYTYERGSARMGADGNDRYSVALRWIGLKPSYVQNELEGQLPQDVYQRLTEIDQLRLEKLCGETHLFHNNHRDGEERLEELELMQSNGYKVELEAMHWLGMNYMSEWLYEILLQEEERLHEDKRFEVQEEEESFADSDSDF